MSDVGALQTLEFVSAVDTDPLVADLPIFDTGSWLSVIPFVAAVAVISIAAKWKSPIDSLTLSNEATRDSSGLYQASSLIEGLTPKNRFVRLTLVRSEKSDIGLDVNLSLFWQSDTARFDADSSSRTNNTHLPLFNLQVWDWIRVQATIDSLELGPAKVTFVWTYGDPSLFDFLIGVRLSLLVLTIPPLLSLIKKLQRTPIATLDIPQRLFIFLYGVSIPYLLPVDLWLAFLPLVRLPFTILASFFPDFVSVHAILTYLPFLTDASSQIRWLICPVALTAASFVAAVVAQLRVPVCAFWPDEARGDIVPALFGAASATVFLVYFATARARLTDVYSVRFKFYSLIAGTYVAFALISAVTAFVNPAIARAPAFIVARFAAVFLYITTVFHGNQETDPADAFANAEVPAAACFHDGNPLGIDIDNTALARA
jgi:hypothetical protein